MGRYLPTAFAVVVAGFYSVPAWWVAAAIGAGLPALLPRTRLAATVYRRLARAAPQQSSSSALFGGLKKDVGDRCTLRRRCSCRLGASGRLQSHAEHARGEYERARPGAYFIPSSYIALALYGRKRG
jgi:hypothetical protein